jgi:hypothetical protein
MHVEGKGLRGLSVEGRALCVTGEGLRGLNVEGPAL